MAVYTHLPIERIAELTRPYGLGELRLALGIAEGVENSNYLIEAEQAGNIHRAIFTIYEKRVRAEDLPFFLSLMQHLAAKGVPCPVPLARSDGALVSHIDGKQAALVSFLDGQSKTLLKEHHCRELGRAAAEMHLAGQDAPLVRPNDLSLSGWQEVYARIAAQLDSIQPGLKKQVKEELVYLNEHWPTRLPRGIIHADLFPNNVFFQGDRLSGIIDFYFACEDMLAYELAICLNCWCFEQPRELNVTKARAMFAGYETVRPLNAKERAAMPTLARGAALRFLLTRAYDWLHHPEGALVTPHDPLDYAHRLRCLQQVSSPVEIGL